MSSLREHFWPMLGDWTGVEHQVASPWGPARSGRAMLVFKLAVADTVVLQDYRQVAEDGSEISGHGVFLLDPRSELVSWWLFDQSGRPPVPAEGSWRRGRLTTERHTDEGTVRHRFTCADDWLLLGVDVREHDDEPWREFLSGRYQRVTGH